MKRDDFDYMKKIWIQLDRYKEAVINKKSQNELVVLGGSLLKELTDLLEYNDQEVIEYFSYQCRQIETRYSSGMSQILIISPGK